MELSSYFAHFRKIFIIEASPGPDRGTGQVGAMLRRTSIKADAHVSSTFYSAGRILTTLVSHDGKKDSHWNMHNENIPESDCVKIERRICEDFFRNKGQLSRALCLDGG